MGFIGRLTCYDVRNKLTSMIGNIYVVKMSMPAASKIAAYLNEAESSVDQIDENVPNSLT